MCSSDLLASGLAIVRVVVAYDIADNKRRTAMARALALIGVRIQESVFTCEVEPEEYDDFVQNVISRADSSVDIVHVFAQCERCRARAVACGDSRDGFLDELYWIV